MTGRATAALLPDGRRLHLQHGPIDLILEVWGPDRRAAYAQAAARFATVLDELVAELPALRRPLPALAAAPGLPRGLDEQCAAHNASRSRLEAGVEFSGLTARRMAAAVRRFPGVFVTPMAAVAGAVADEILAHAIRGLDVPKAYANNGGDVAFHLTPGKSAEAMGAAGPIAIAFEDPPRGLATSGWRGRSHSLGIADAVTVAARDAATADAAATLIANAVDLPGHPAVTRAPASALNPNSDLGDRPVTTGVGALTPSEIDAALAAGLARARRWVEAGLIAEASLTLQGRTVIAAAETTREIEHA